MANDRYIFIEHFMSARVYTAVPVGQRLFTICRAIDMTRETVRRKRHDTTGVPAGVRQRRPGRVHWVSEERSRRNFTRVVTPQYGRAFAVRSRSPRSCAHTRIRRGSAGTRYSARPATLSRGHDKRTQCLLLLTRSRCHQSL